MKDRGRGRKHVKGQIPKCAPPLTGPNGVGASFDPVGQRDRLCSAFGHAGMVYSRSCMGKLADYVQKWKLLDPQPLAVTATSRLYAVMWNEQPAVLKLFTAAGMQDEKHGALALQWFNGKAAVRLLSSDDQAQLLEYADGENLKSLVQKGADEKASIIIANVLNTLHCAHPGPAPQGLTTLKSRYRSLFKKAKQDAGEGITSVYTKAADIAGKLLAAEKDFCILHGDMHHENVKYSAKRGWLAIDPKGLYGERTYDAANVLCNPTGMDDFVANEARLIRTAEILAQVLRLDMGRLLAFTFAHASLSASWSLEDGEDPSLALKIADIAESLYRKGSRLTPASPPDRRSPVTRPSSPDRSG